MLTQTAVREMEAEGKIQYKSSAVCAGATDAEAAV